MTETMSTRGSIRRSPARRAASLVRDLGEAIIITLAIFLVVRATLQNFRVDGSSMYPTFHSGEYIIVDRFEYWLHNPQRGDVVVFRAVPAREPGRDFIKRIIGVPGDRVDIRNNHVYIDGHTLREPYIAAPPSYTFGPVTVPANKYFVLGDNRNNSYDSSRWTATPFLARRYIIGKALLAYWPLKDLTVFHDPSYN
jgi:signal peptidase I